MLLIHPLLILLHLLAATVWVGGMVAMHFAVRPAAAATLQPPLRLPFMAAALGRFFAAVALAIVVILGTGFGMVALNGGFARLHWSVHAMVGLGLVMTALFGHLRFAAYPRLQRAVKAADWPVAATALAGIRRLVAVNLSLGTLVFAVVILGPSFG